MNLHKELDKQLQSLELDSKRNASTENLLENSQ